MPRSSPLRSTAALAGWLCLLLLPTQRLHAAEEADSSVVAQAGDTKLTADEIRTAVEHLDANTKQEVENDPSALGRIIRATLAQRLVVKEALDKKWDQNPTVAAGLERLRENNIAQTYLQSVSAPPDSYPSDAELQAVYDANKAQLLVPRQYHLAQIFIKNMKGADAGTAAKAQVKLEAVRKALAKHDADFGAIATAESDETQSAAKGGEIGWLSDGKIQPEIRAQLGTLAKGSVTKPVRLDDGWHILKVLEVKDAYTPGLDEIRPALVQRMRAAREQQNV